MPKDTLNDNCHHLTEAKLPHLLFKKQGTFDFSLLFLISVFMGEWFCRLHNLVDIFRQ